MESSRTKALVLAAALVLPLAGLALLLAVPELDVHWEHHPSHFWLVIIAAVFGPGTTISWTVTPGPGSVERHFTLRTRRDDRRP